MTDKFSFNFGPISRTLGENGNHLGFASLPVHEAVTSLLGARNRDEFIAWLWHDTFKMLFTLVPREKKIKGGSTITLPAWSHIPGKLDVANLDAHFDCFAQTPSIEVDPNLCDDAEATIAEGGSLCTTQLCLSADSPHNALATVYY